MLHGAAVAACVPHAPPRALENSQPNGSQRPTESGLITLSICLHYFLPRHLLVVVSLELMLVDGGGGCRHALDGNVK